MEQLPPKAPTTMAAAHHWPSPSFPFHIGGVAPPSSWMDEFLDFSASRRSSHRRTVSDPIAFVEDEPSHHIGGGGGGSFDRLDDEQLRSMFSDDPSTSAPSEEDDDVKKSAVELNRPKTEPGEIDGSTEPAPAQNESPEADSIVDPKRIKRILANRQSAQRSRVRKLQYISELERSVTSLQTEVSALSPRVAYLDHQRLLLNVDNSALKQRIAALAQDKIFKDAHQEALRKEIERLRNVFNDQQNKKKNVDNKEDE